MISNLKKNLAQEINNNQEHELFFFDESRFGTHSRMGHGWFQKGSRTLIKKKLGFKNFYLYSAVSPSSGDDFSLISPAVDSDCMNMFLQQMSKWLEARKALIVMDQAGWHKSKNLVIPSNIKLFYLPPYSPELNPVERLWKHIKDNVLKNRVFESLDELENQLCCFFRSISRDDIKSICSANYMSCYL